jgi:hypothetical protein
MYAGSGGGLIISRKYKLAAVLAQHLALLFREQRQLFALLIDDPQRHG